MEASTLVIATGCIAAMLALVLIRGKKDASWRTLEALYPSPASLEGPDYRLPLCWFGTRLEPFRNAFRAQLGGSGIRVRGIGPWGWFREPILLPWAAARTLHPVEPLGLGAHFLRMEVDGIEIELTFPKHALPALAHHGVIPSRAA